MTRKSFLNKLNKKLHKFDKEERDEAVSFYSDLFDEMDLNDDDEIPKDYDVNKIARDLTLSIKIDNWEEEDTSISKIFKSIPIITLSILSLPTILIGLIIFLALIFTATLLIIGAYFTITLFIIGTIQNFLASGVAMPSVILLIGVVFLVISITGILIELVNFIGKVILSKIKGKIQKGV